MREIVPLAALAPRIMVCGPSNSGKSTLARAIGGKLGLPVTHLDLLYHLPNTNWEPRPKDEFVALHDAAIADIRWVIEGNYFATIPQRLARATGIVLLGSEPWRAAARNVRRTLFETRDRAGQLEGGIDKLSWRFLRFIVFEQPKKRDRDRAILKASGVPMVELASMRDLQVLCEAWGLRGRH
jgi:adenylate kinase family enzyme